MRPDPNAADPIGRLLRNPPALPVLTALPELRAALDARGLAVVQAPPGTGKTTLVPPALADHYPGRIIVTQPRRIAVRAAARRLAHLLGEQVGQSVGFSVRGERQVSAATRIEIVTTGVLVRRLQRDPELAGTSAVILDEVHERQLESDLALALLVDVRANLRPDLALVAMSATVEAERTAQVLALHDDAGPAPVVQVAAELFALTQQWAPFSGPRTDARGVTPAFLDHIAATIKRTMATHDGDVLAFLPGVGEVMAVVRRLGGSDAAVLPLHGRLPAAEQDRALSAGPRRRIIVSTALAESSVTVPGVRIVIDAGFSREPRTDHRRGMAGLVTVSVSKAAAEQRAGRAARESPGIAVRCWAEHDHARLAAHPTPQIETADLTSFALELATWGSTGGTDLALLDPPPPAALAVAQRTLFGLGALDDGGQLTVRGRQLSSVPVDPRLARALLDGAPIVGAQRAAEVVALMSDDVRVPDADLVAALRAIRRGGPSNSSWRSQTQRLLAVIQKVAGDRQESPGAGAELSNDLAVGAIVALAHPERIARRRPTGGAYLLVSGTGAVLPPGSPLTGYDWLAIADLDRAPGRGDAMVRAAAPIDVDLALEAASSWLDEDETVTWRAGGVHARRTTRLGAIELSSDRIAQPEPQLVIDAIRTGLSLEGLGALRWSEAAVALRDRLGFLHGVLGEPWPDMSDAALLAGLDLWLGPDLMRVRKVGDLARIDVLTAQRRLLPWPQAGRLDELAPERIATPNGSMGRVDYSGEQPVLALRVQEAFGWRQVPRIADGRVPVLLHLLSPARRPAAITADLETFWQVGYPQVRADLRGRYPKHNWPQDPLTATPDKPRAPRRR